MRKILLLGSTGKMGMAITKAFSETYEVIGKNSKDVDARDFTKIKAIIEDEEPDIVINTIAYLGIDKCEEYPTAAFILNTQFPRFLAKLSDEKGFLLVHFSTDAVFNGEERNKLSEFDCPCPVNMYGLTKYGGDCFVRLAKKHYVFRISLLFGETTKTCQIVEKLITKAINEKSIDVSDDIISSPSYSKDVAEEVKRVIEREYSYGLYHITNGGQASLYELMKEITKAMSLDAKVNPVSFKSFASSGIKNEYTPLTSLKTFILRPWQDAVKEFYGRKV